MKTRILLTIICCFGTTTAVGGMQALEVASDKLCQKVKQCTFEQMQREQGITPQMRTMVEGMLSSMCENLMEFNEADTYHELVEPATACMDSMSALSCEDIEENDMQTAECEEYEALAKKYEQER